MPRRGKASECLLEIGLCLPTERIRPFTSGDRSEKVLDDRSSLGIRVSLKFDRNASSSQHLLKADNCGPEVITLSHDIFVRTDVDAAVSDELSQDCYLVLELLKPTDTPRHSIFVVPAVLAQVSLNRQTFD